MSHIVTIDVEFKDLDILKKACGSVGATFEQARPGKSLRKKIYSTRASGIASIQLPRWLYPIVVDAKGKITFDNFRGSWGPEKALHGLRQKYAELKVEKSARALGFRVARKIEEPNGTVRLTLKK